MVKLSIITINFNDKKGLEKTMKSVVAQTSTDFEYIVIDGGSTDGSLDLIKEYAHKISYWVSEPDTGIYNAMNKGISRASGEYCQFLNSGDYLASNTVTEEMLANNEISSFIYGNMLKLMSNGKVYPNKQIETNSLFTFYRSSLNHSTTYIKRNLFEKYGYYDENLKIVSDWKFFLKAIGINGENVSYQDVDVIYFDMNGISNTNKQLEAKERRLTLEEIIPSSVLADFDRYGSDIRLMNRINKNTIVKKIVLFTERILFKLEKWGFIK